MLSYYYYSFTFFKSVTILFGTILTRLQQPFHFNRNGFLVQADITGAFSIFQLVILTVVYNCFFFLGSIELYHDNKTKIISMRNVKLTEIMNYLVTDIFQITDPFRQLFQFLQNFCSLQLINPPTLASTNFQVPKLPTTISAYFPWPNFVPIPAETSRTTKQSFFLQS